VAAYYGGKRIDSECLGYPIDFYLYNTSGAFIDFYLFNTETVQFYILWVEGIITLLLGGEGSLPVANVLKLFFDVITLLNA
jgi:hypothetical protein